MYRTAYYRFVVIMKFYLFFINTLSISNEEIVRVSGTNGFRTFYPVKVRVFRRLRASHQKLPYAGGVGRGMFVASGLDPV